MVDFASASRAEMQGWTAEEWVYGVLWGVAQPAETLSRGVARWIGEGRL